LELAGVFVFFRIKYIISSISRFESVQNAKIEATSISVSAMALFLPFVMAKIPTLQNRQFRKTRLKIKIDPIQDRSR
jgi:hypothetical protein